MLLRELFNRIAPNTVRKIIRKKYIEYIFLTDSSIPILLYDNNDDFFELKLHDKFFILQKTQHSNDTIDLYIKLYSIIKDPKNTSKEFGVLTGHMGNSDYSIHVSNDSGCELSITFPRGNFNILNIYIENSHGEIIYDDSITLNSDVRSIEYCMKLTKFL